MVRELCRFEFLACIFATIVLPGAARSAPFEVRNGDRIVFVGGTFIERMQQFGYLETLLTVAHPEMRITFRNLGWSGDTVWGDSRALFGTQIDGYNRLVNDVKEAKPSVLVICYGANEAHAGEPGLRRFVDGFNHLLDDLASTKARLVLLSPHAYAVGPAGTPEPTVYNTKLKLYCRAIEQLAKERDACYVSLFDLMDVMQNSPTRVGTQTLTDSGMHLTDNGYRMAAFEIAKRLGIDLPELNFAVPDQRIAELQAAIQLKNEFYFHRYRPQNETYLFLFRKHEQGNNAVEIPQFDPLVEEQEKRIAVLNGSK